jgi:N-acetylmuramoyl-L-alanine amidase
MSFKQKFSITPRYLSKPSKRRSGLLISPSVRFLVAHDTGNPDSTAIANATYYERTHNAYSVSTHIFVDDKDIIECIPALTDVPEKAWHVLYGVATDVLLFGVNANDGAIGVELCYGSRIHPDESYVRYVWTLAFACYKFDLDPRTAVVGHFLLDPTRKTDPVSGLSFNRRTYDQLLAHVAEEYDECRGIMKSGPPLISQSGIVTAHVKLNIRKGMPSTKAPVARVVGPGTKLVYVGITEDGESIFGNRRWYRDEQGNYYWAGAVRQS